jgi:hypothetical protein
MSIRSPRSMQHLARLRIHACTEIPVRVPDRGRYLIAMNPMVACSRFDLPMLIEVLPECAFSAGSCDPSGRTTQTGRALRGLRIRPPARSVTAVAGGVADSHSRLHSSAPSGLKRQCPTSCSLLYSVALSNKPTPVRRIREGAVHRTVPRFRSAIE